MSYPILMFGAGLGTRMGELTATRPKPLVNLAGMPLIDHAIALTDGQNVGPKVVNVHAFADQMRAHLANRDIVICRRIIRIMQSSQINHFHGDLMRHFG